MMSVWWLCLIVPVSICSGLIIASFMKGAFTEEREYEFDERELY